MTALIIIAAAAAAGVAAIVNGFEIGIYSLSHVRLRYRISINDPRAAVVERLLSRPQAMISGILVAQNAAIYVATALVTGLFQSRRAPFTEVLSTLVLALVFFVFVEAIPKNVFRRGADVLVYPLARPFRMALALLMPVGKVLEALTRLMSRFTAARGGVVDPFFTRERLSFYLREGHSEGLLSKYQVELADNILRGERVTVRRAMVELERVAAVPRTVAYDEFLAFARERRFSRYPVYDGAKSNVVGVMNVYDFRLKGRDGFDVEALMRQPAFFTPEVRVTEGLRNLRESRQPMGIVVEKGAAIGVVTMKDCLEEIVGELHAW